MWKKASGHHWEYPWIKWYLHYDVVCPGCGTEFKKGNMDHHLDMLIPARSQILKFWPRFESHPVFDDLETTPKQAASGTL